MSDPDLSPLAVSLGRLPTGLFVVTTLDDGRPLGFIGSLLTQVGFDPPTVCVAIGRDRQHLAAIRSSGRFAVSILDAESQGLMGAFFKRYDGEGTPFDSVEHRSAPGGAPVLTGSLAWLDCSVSGEHDVGDHIVVFGTVEAGEKLRDGEPSIHLRENGLAY
jgi:3-hydroxy-9,10-secoandrosta-1,3,5(10)-triene-9,17-dione monooxygenase reductase component